MSKNSTTSCEAPDLPDEDKWSPEMVIRGDAAKQLTSAMLILLGDSQNYTECTLRHPKHGFLRLHLQKMGDNHITPGIKIERLEKKVKELEEKLKEAGIEP